MRERIDLSSGEPDTIDLAEIGRTVRRNVGVVVAFAALGVLAGLAVTLFAPKRFQGRSTIMARVSGSGAASIGGRIDGVGELLGGLGGIASGSSMETELQILRSRELAGKVVDSLKLQFRLHEPRLAPHLVFADADLQPSFAPSRVRFERLAGGYRATAGDSTWTIVPGQPSPLGIGTITLHTNAVPESFDVTIRDREDAIDRFISRLQVTKAGGDVARVVFTGDDSLSAAMAANLLTDLYLETHRTVDRGVNQRRVEFVESQLDSTARMLTQAERSLREYQEASKVIDYEVVGEAEVEGAATQRQELTRLQVEEGTMRRLLAQADRGQLTPRDLAAYPGFLGGTTAASLAHQLTALEAERIRLLQRRTERDPEVIAIDKTMRTVEANIVAMARSYTESITKQRTEAQERHDSLQARILAIPAAAERGGRLKRDVIRLTQMYTALQAQLVEARFGAVSEGGLLRQIDVATPQREPSFPKPILTMGLGTASGLLCGLVGALFLGWFGRWLRDPVEVERAVGVLAHRYELDAPLLMGATPASRSRTVLLVPLGDRAPISSVAQRLARTARQRDLQPVVVDLSASHTDESSPPMNGGVGSVIERLERENTAVIVQLPALDTETTFAALSDSRPVLFVAPPGPIDRSRLHNAVNTLRRLNVPCAGVIMHDGDRRKQLT